MSRAVDREVTVPVPPEEVWKAIEDPERLGDWLGAGIELDLRPGGRGRFDLDDGEVRHGIVHTVDPGRELEFSWWAMPGGGGDSSTVTITLAPDGAGGTVIGVREARAAGSLRAAA